MKRIASRFPIMVICALLFILNPNNISGQDTEGLSVDFDFYEGNPVLTRGAEGEWDSAVVVLGCVLYHNEQFHMFYSGGTENSGAFAIGYASSVDGLNWTKSESNPVFTVDESLSLYGINPGPCYIEEDRWVLFVQPRDTRNFMPSSTFLRAEAPEPTGNWELGEMIIDAQDDSKIVRVYPHSITLLDSEYILYYSAMWVIPNISHFAIGRAISTDGINYLPYNDESTEEGLSDPIFADDANHTIFGAAARPIDTGWEMFYGEAYGSTWSSYQISYARSVDGLTWTPYSGSPILESEEGVWWPQLVVLNDTYYLYHMSPVGDPLTENIGLAIGTVSTR